MAKISQLAKMSSREVVNPVKRSTMMAEVIARERILVYRMVQEETDIIKHFSHPHALREYKFQERHRIVCDACELDLLGEAYGCAKCDFHLHKSCFEAPRELEHGGHPKHTLKLLSRTPYPAGRVICNGCGEENRGFDYHCACCNYDLHIDCAHLPKVMKRDDHRHTLALYYSFPYFQYSGEEYCDVCRNSIDKRRWVYGCRQCKYWCHSDCIFREAISLSEDDEDEDEDDKREVNIRTTAWLVHEMSSKLRLK
ncbi:hypothetical protein Ancab_025397 [Ancistrocladus abbreviatus]